MKGRYQLRIYVNLMKFVLFIRFDQVATKYQNAATSRKVQTLSNFIGKTLLK